MKHEYVKGQGGINRATLTIAATLGVIFGFSGIGHGLFETLQGSVPTNGPFILAIGEANRFWEYGNEPAFTVLPTFLAAGITTMAVGVAVIVWSAGFLGRKYGPSIYLVLFVLLFLVGGGIAQVVFFTAGWAISARARKPLHWWRKAFRSSVLRFLAVLWKPLLAACAAFILFTLEIAIFGFVPGVASPEVATTVMLCSAVAGFVFMILASLSGFADDARRRVF